MGRQQFRLLVCSATAIALLAGSLLAIPWFEIDLLGSVIEIDLQSASVCSAENVCMSVPLSKLHGLYPATATVSFYAGLLLLLVVIVQSASKIVTGAVHDRVTRIGYILAVATIVCGFSAGYLFGPDGTGLATAVKSITVERTWAPLLFVLGTLSAFAALYYASSELIEDVVEYKPIQIDKRLPVTPLTNKIVTRGSGSIPLEGSARNARPPTQPPLDRRPITPSGGLRTEDLRSKTPSSPGRTTTPSTGSRIDDLRSPPLSPPTRSLTPGGSFARTDATGRSMTPSGGFARTDMTPTGGFARDATTPGGGFVRIEDTRTRPPTQPPTDARTRPPTQPPFARIEDTRTKSPSQPPSGDPSRGKSPSQPPFVARTTSPSGIADPTRSKSASQQPFVARTTSPSGIADPSRTKTSSQPPFVARTTSPSGIADPTRSKSPSQAPIDLVARARTSSSGPIDLAARLSASVPNPLEGAPNLAVSIRPPLPTPEPVPPDQIPVDPAAGLTIRKRTASAAPHSELTLTPVIGTPVTPPRGEMALTPVGGTPVTPPGGEMALAPATASPSADLAPTGSTPSLPDHAFAPPVAIPTPPESGLLIRARRPSAAPPTEKPGGDDVMPRITVDGLENLAEALATAVAAAPPVAEPLPPSATATSPSATATSPSATATSPSATATSPSATATSTTTKPHELPDYIRGKIKFAVLTAELASAGIKARREDGLEKLVTWDEVVGIVARRLPADKPFEGATVVDLLSSAGATLRIVPWTKLDGHPFESKAVERARSFVNVIAAMALDAKLDSATKTFANGDGDAAQLPSVAALATHDSKVG